MSDEQQTAADEQQPGDATPEAEAPAQEPDWKAMARKWEERAKTNSAAAEELAQLKESQKTEAEKMAERLEAAEKSLADYQHREQVQTWAKEISESDEFKGVPAAALRGNTREELEEHAALLKSLIPAEQPRKGAVAPYIPSEGKTPSGSLGGNAQLWADLVGPVLN